MPPIPPIFAVPLTPTQPVNDVSYPNRVGIALVHSTRYAFEGQVRLAHDVGVSRSTISRMVRGKSRPSLALAQDVTEALSLDLGVSLQPSDLFSEDGTYDQPSGCRVCGCDGCLPEEAYDAKGNRRPAFATMRPGDWTLAPKRHRRDAPLTNVQSTTRFVGTGWPS